jgi:hypothetical protein
MMEDLAPEDLAPLTEAEQRELAERLGPLSAEEKVSLMLYVKATIGRIPPPADAGFLSWLAREGNLDEDLVGQMRVIPEGYEREMLRLLRLREQPSPPRLPGQ